MVVNVLRSASAEFHRDKKGAFTGSTSTRLSLRFHTDMVNKQDTVGILP